jgi:hypothetical protein
VLNLIFIILSKEYSPQRALSSQRFINNHICPKRFTQTSSRRNVWIMAQGVGHKAQGKQYYTVGAGPCACPRKMPDGINFGQPQGVAPTNILSIMINIFFRGMP